MDPSFQYLKPGDRVDAEELTRLGKTVARLTASNPSAGLEQLSGPCGPLFRPASAPYLWIKITGSSGAAYAWTAEMFVSGTASNRTPTISGTTSLYPAYEVNGSTTVPTNTIAQAWLAEDGLSYLFAQGGNGASLNTYTKTVVTNVVCNGDGTISVTSESITYYGP